VWEEKEEDVTSCIGKEVWISVLREERTR
jgi:hypothetical protein